jgi:hypothetical protein
MATKFIYLYRDGANYKSWGELILAGKPKESYEANLRDACQMSKLFVAEQVGIPPVYLYTEEGGDWSYDPETDHGFHEFHELEASNERPSKKRHIQDLVVAFRNVGRWRPQTTLYPVE